MLKRRVLLIVLVLSGAHFGAAPSADAQTMSLSVYTDAYVNEDGLFSMWGNVIDNSSGCGHTQYMTTANIQSPSGRVAQRQSSGLASDTSIWVGEDEGSYSAYITGTYLCGCNGPPGGGGGPAGYGGGQLYSVRPYTARYGWSLRRSDALPHGPNSNDVYERAACTGFCQTDILGYKHHEGFGHDYIEVKGFDTIYPDGRRVCRGRAAPKVDLPHCKPT
jgi:hypothetical protein